MKYLFLFATIAAAIGYSCSEDDQEPALPDDEEILTQRIEDIIPTQYLDSLEKLGLQIHSGTHPPDVAGTYMMQPHILDTSSVETDVPGFQFHDATLDLFEQSSEDFSIKFISKYVLGRADTSIATAISGSGNDFTVYGKVKATTGNYTAIFAIVLSATREDGDLKNLRVGLINVDNSQGGTGIFIDEGEGRINYDSDLTSENITSPQTAREKVSAISNSSGGALLAPHQTN